MGLRRYERVKNSTRPAPKLGGGGGWNTAGRKEDENTNGTVGGGVGGSGEILPPFPGTHPSAKWGVQAAGAAAAGGGPSGSGSGSGSAEKKKDYCTTIKPSDMPRMKAFSGRGWRNAAPGFGDEEDAVKAAAAAAARPKEPKLLIGNLATDVAPEALRDLIETRVDGLDLDVPGELKAVHMAVFGPARWGRQPRENTSCSKKQETTHTVTHKQSSKNTTFVNSDYYYDYGCLLDE